MEPEHGARAEAIERLAALFMERQDLVDWRVLESIDQRAWDK